MQSVTYLLIRLLSMIMIADIPLALCLPPQEKEGSVSFLGDTTVRPPRQVVITQYGSVVEQRPLRGRSFSHHHRGASYRALQKGSRL